MKNFLIVALLSVAMLLLGGCGGDISNVRQIPVESDIYTQEEIHSAVDTAMQYFRNHFSGCTMTQIQYAGDGQADAFAEWAEDSGADQAIILISTFEVDGSGGDGSLNPNSTYTRYQWILVRDAGGAWRHLTHGY